MSFFLEFVSPGVEDARTRNLDTPQSEGFPRNDLAEVLKISYTGDIIF